MRVAQISWFLQLIWDKPMIMALRLFVFMVPHKKRKKQMISPNTQIIGEKPQTVIGPLWAIIYPCAALTLMMASCAVWKCDLHSPASWRRSLTGGPARKSHLSLPCSPHSRLILWGCSFSLILSEWAWCMVLEYRGGEIERYRFFQMMPSSKSDNLLFLSPPCFFFLWFHNTIHVFVGWWLLFNGYLIY